MREIIMDYVVLTYMIFMGVLGLVFAIMAVVNQVSTYRLHRKFEREARDLKAQSEKDFDVLARGIAGMFSAPRSQVMSDEELQ